MSSTPPPSQPAYVLHSRAYRETSALVDFLTPQGRLRAVLRSARGKAGTLARPFVALDVEFRGKGELKNVGRLESVGNSAWLNGEALFSGLYLNELLIRLLPAHKLLDAEPLAIARSRTLLRRYWAAVTAVADLLQARGTVDGEAVCALLSAVTGEPPLRRSGDLHSLDR